MADATRNTRQKTAIRAAFTEQNRPLTPEEVLTLAKAESSGLSIATVYRNIGSLLEEGWLQMVGVPGMPSRYEVAGKPHHHHFHCSTCGRLFELHGCSLPESMRLPEGFRAVSHDLLVHGTCLACG